MQRQRNNIPPANPYPEKATLYFPNVLDNILGVVALILIPLFVLRILGNYSIASGFSGEPLHISIWLLCHVPYLLLALGAVFILFGFPLRIMFDAETDTLNIRSLAWTRRIPMADVDSLLPVCEFESKAFRYVITFKKHLFRQPFPLTRPVASFSYLASFRSRDLIRIGDALHSYRLKHENDPEPKPDQRIEGKKIWREVGGIWYLWYPLALRLIVTNAVVFGMVVFLDRQGALEAIAEGVADGGVSPVYEFRRYVYLGVVALMTLNLFVSNICLRFDPARGIVSRYRMLGLWRTDFDCRKFDTLMLENGFCQSGLYMAFHDRRCPLLLLRSRSPERLRSALLQTAEVLEIDPWDNFTAHGKVAARD